MSKKNEILQHMSAYSVSDQVAQIITMIAGIVTRNILGPAAMGLWSIVSLVLEYASYSTLGTTIAVAREIPYYQGKRDEETAKEIKNLVASFGGITSLAAASGVALYALWNQGRMQDSLFWGLLCVAVMIVLQRWNNVIIALLRAHKKFDIAGRQMILSACVNLLLILALAYPFGLYGFMVAMILSLLFNIFYIARQYRFDFRFVLNKKILDLIAFGLPLMILGLSSALFKSVDKILIIRMMGFEAMGHYSVAVMAAAFLGRIPNAMGVILIPHFQEKYGARDRAEDLKGYVDKSIFGFYSVMPPVIGIAWIFAPWGVRWLLPEYVNGIAPLQILILSSFFFALSFPYGDLMITLKRHWILFPITAVCIGLAALLDFAAIKAGWGLLGVAAMTVLTLFLYFSALFVSTARLLYTSQEAWNRYGTILWRFTVMLLALWILEKGIVFSNIAVRMAVQTFFFLLIQGPFLRGLNREFDVLSHFKITRK